MGLLLETIVFLNRFFPRPRIYGRESDDAYSLWEYDTGKLIFRHFGTERLRGARMLDAGCGMGGKTVWYAETGAAAVFGVDLQLRNAAQSGRFAASRGQGQRVHVAVANVMHLPFADGTFDVVTANDSMEHFADPAAALRELGRVLRPGGRLYLYFTPYRSPLGSHLYDHVKIPWCQILLPRGLLYAALERVLHDEELARGGADAEARAAERYRDTVEYFETCLNGITVQRFRAILAAESTLRRCRIHYEPPKYKFLRPLLLIPAWREYFAGLVFADLERV